MSIGTVAGYRLPGRKAMLMLRRLLNAMGKFYWYVAVSHGSIAGKAIGVAVSDKPQGPYADAIGRALITNETIGVPGENKINLDPTVLIDDNGQAYLFWGNSQCFYVKRKRV